MEPLLQKIEARRAHFAPADEELDFKASALPNWERAATSRSPDEAPAELREPMERIQWLYYRLNRVAARILDPNTSENALPGLRQELGDLNETRDLLNDQLRRLNAHVEATHRENVAVALRLNCSQLSQRGSTDAVSATREHSFELPPEWVNATRRPPSAD